MDGKEEEAVDMMTIKEKQNKINRTALEADSSIKIQKRGTVVIKFYVFLLECFFRHMLVNLRKRMILTIVGMGAEG